MTNPSAPDAQLTETLRGHIAGDLDQVRQQLTTLIAHPSVHGADMAACRAAADDVIAMFAEIGLELEAHETSDGSLALTGHHPAPEGMPTVLLYAHYDVQPAGDEQEWTSSPWELTERHNRWYGRGTADCKGNITMHLAALRALSAAGKPWPGIRVVIEGSEERGSAGLHDLVAQRPELFAADTILIADVGNVAVGQPTLVTALRGTADVDIAVQSLASPVHSGAFGGAAPDALATLIRLLDSLYDEHGVTTIDGLQCAGTWAGQAYDPQAFRTDAGVQDGACLLSERSEATIADLLWARPAVTVTGIDCPPATNAVNAIPANVSAHLNLRVPAGMDPQQAQDALIAHLEKHMPATGVLTVEPGAVAAPFASDTSGPAIQQLEACLSASYGQPTVYFGQGGSIPLCATLLEAMPDADLALFGIEEPQCRIHSADESVDPNEIRDIAVAEALFLATMSSE
ncbi:dipeptidase [Corynebacterium sp. TAE3-ERU12]|uniref:dipeptidase n=1 Tax=Corynebacterium sp. TAE3-ERU12 TaxID=2849491 RepID=UPI001C46BE2F|nr:dipeptidase [Corynebacterium sp. TAE3-ERU12]MBV7295945.1 dipeptidase [Corynebacterium sp. TAE3-ERU12]